MKSEKLKFTSFEKAIISLEEVLDVFSKEPVNTFLRDASIQRFEYTYELSHKMVRRYLKSSEPDADEIERMTFSALIRTASEKGLLLSEWKIWKKYRDARNLTSHTYDEEIAKSIVKILPGFLKDAEFLLGQLKKRVDD